ncbi:MAG: hypothetical protein IKX50_07990 [Spirochaetia bacterium]|nr:hypothetical protein [Spirochaetia bacterium]
MKNKSFIIIFLVLCILFIMSGCDGSSSSSDDPAGIVGSKYSSVPEDRSGVSVGDIVFADKKTCTAANYKADAASYAEAGDVVGIVVYKGETDSVGITDKVYLIGLNQGTDLIWAPDATTGYTTEFGTSKTAGEGNWAVIETTDAAGAADAATNYPAFNYAKTYRTTGYTEGWFLPSFNEIRNIYDARYKINDGVDAITAVGGSAAKLPTSGYLCSSSQSEGNADCISRVALNNGAGSGFGDKKSAYVVRVVHTLD